MQWPHQAAGEGVIDVRMGVQRVNSRSAELARGEEAAEDDDAVATETVPEDEPVGWVLLYDVAWEESEDEEPPPELVAGGWPLLSGGGLGPFHVNDLHGADPDSDPEAPEDPDPIGAALALMLEGRAGVDLVQLVLRDSLVHVATDVDGAPMVVRSLGERPCLLVATCAARRAESDPPGWQELDVEDLADLVTVDFDVAFNLAGPRPVRLPGQVVLDAAFQSDEQAYALLEPAVTEFWQTNGPELGS